MWENIRRAFGWIFALGGVERIERVSLVERTRFEQARLDAGLWGRDGGWTLAICLGVLPLLIGGVVGITASEWVAGILLVFGSMALLYVLALIRFAWQAPTRALNAVRGQSEDLRGEVRSLRDQAPRLALGRVEIPKHSMKYLVGGDDATGFYVSGRVLLVPVLVSRGTDNAESVRARLTFLPDDADGQFSPRNPVFAEWAIDDGSLPTTVEIPSNGLPMHFCVAFVANEGHPAVFAWTQESRALGLGDRAFWVASHPVEIHVEVSGSGHGAAAPFVEDTLQITWHNAMLNAKWASADPEDNQPGVHRPQRQIMPRPRS